jgi:hypothetical protein
MERRYRKELNTHIARLRDIVPSCQNQTGMNINKVIILKKAVDYVKILRQRENDLVGPPFLFLLLFFFLSLVKASGLTIPALFSFRVHYRH